MRFSKEARQKIIDDFGRRHNQWDAAVFLQEVRDTGPSHDAYEWFEWDQDKAAHNYQLEQARAFASGLTIRFQVEEIGRNKSIRIKVMEMPLVQSPVEGRRGGGGYRFVDPDNPEHMREHCRQGAAALRGWLDRYGAALRHAGYPQKNFEQAMALLEKASSPQSEAAE